jgi:hypothetical protein
MAWRTEEDWRIHREEIQRLEIQVRMHERFGRNYTSAIVGLVVLASVLALIADNFA